MIRVHVEVVKNTKNVVEDNADIVYEVWEWLY